MKRVGLLVVILPWVGSAQINYSGGAYLQDFDTLASGMIYTPYTNMPAGWIVGSAFNSGSYVWTTVTNGFSNNYGKYCFSLMPGDPDRSIGLVIGSTGQAHLGARFRNASGVIFTSFSLSYFVEQWRKGTVTSNDQAIPFSYSLDATTLTAGTFVNVTALDMHSINDGDGAAAAMNGNAVSNRLLITATVSGISWLPNQELWIRWSGVSYPFFAAHALAIDDLSFHVVPALKILPNGSAGHRISWPTNYTGWVLQSALTPTATTWDTLTTIPAIMGSDFSIDSDATDVQRFFRLKLQ